MSVVKNLAERWLVVEKLLVTLAVASWDDSRSAARALGQSTPNCRGVRTSCMFRPLWMKSIFDMLSIQWLSYDIPHSHNELKSTYFDHHKSRLF